MALCHYRRSDSCVFNIRFIHGQSVLRHTVGPSMHKYTHSSIFPNNKPLIPYNRMCCVFWHGGERIDDVLVIGPVMRDGTDRPKPLEET